MLELFIILLCWVVQMPLWCSIVGTVICSLHLILSVVSDVIHITGRDQMETVLGILFLVQLAAFIGIICYVACNYEDKLKDAETKAQAEEIANKLEICLKDMEIKRLEEEIKKLKKRKKSK